MIVCEFCFTDPENIFKFYVVKSQWSLLTTWLERRTWLFSHGHKLDEASLHFLHTVFAWRGKNLRPTEVPPFVKLLGREIIKNAPIPMVRTPWNETVLVNAIQESFLPTCGGKVSHRGLVRTSQSELVTDKLPATWHWIHEYGVLASCLIA